MTKGLYIGTIVVLFLVITITFIIVLKSKRKKKLIKEINRLEKEKNMLINVPVLNEFNKVEALVKNNKLEDKYNGWKLKFDIINEETIPMINDMLIDVDFMIEKNKAKDIYQKITEIEIKLNSCRCCTNFA